MPLHLLSCLKTVCDSDRDRKYVALNSISHQQHSALFYRFIPLTGDIASAHVFISTENQCYTSDYLRNLKSTPPESVTIVLKGIVCNAVLSNLQVDVIKCCLVQE